MIPWICFFICYIWAGIAMCTIADDVTNGDLSVLTVVLLFLFWWIPPIFLLLQKILTIHANWRISRRNKQRL